MGSEKNIADLILQGIQFREQGDLAGAVACYQQAVALPGAPAAAYFNLGNALFAQGEWSAARASVLQALDLDAAMVSARMLLARCEHRLGDLAAARLAYTLVLKTEPDNFSAWLEVGHVCRAMGQTQQMVASYERAAAVAPQRWEVMASLTRAQEDAEQWEAAARCYQRAVTLVAQMAEAARAGVAQDTESGKVPLAQPSVFALHWRVARFRLERGDTPRALEALRQALLVRAVDARRPGAKVDANETAALHIDLAEALMRLGMTDEAHRAFEQASRATDEAVLVRLAETSFRYNLWQEAHEILRRNVDLHPDSANALWNLAHLYAEIWHMEEALNTLAKAEAIAPQPGAMSMRASVAGRTGDAETAFKLYKALADAEGPRSKMCSSAAMSSLYSDQLSAAEVAQLHRELFAPLGQGARRAASFGNAREPDKRLRLGLVTADFHHQHPVNIFMQPVLARLDPAQFDVTVYFTGGSYDEQTQLARSRARQWVECTTWNDRQLARRIEDDGIDLLLDLAGHTSMHRMGMFAQRAAPVQTTFLGYPGSTGVPCMDWIMTDPVVAPEGSEDFYSEWVYRLPHTVFCFAPEVDYPYPAYGAEHAARPLTFGSFNNVPKLTQHTLALWARVLQAVPGSRLLLKAPSFKDEGAIKAFKARFAALGIGEDRLAFRGPVGLTDMMAEYADVDIALDPVPYNGGTTTLQAMWMGVPVVVKAGHNFVSRMGASFMTAAGLPDWVAHSDDEYVAIAQRMAADRQALLALKQGFRARQLAAPAWDIAQYTRDFEAALRQMWMDFCAGEAAVRDQSITGKQG
jgi:protein O-GlcNAc transferase